MNRPDLTTNGFELVQNNGQQGIKCLDCGLTSYHPKDIEHKYCGNCHKFHPQKLTGFEFPVETKKGFDKFNKQRRFLRKNIEKLAAVPKPLKVKPIERIKP